jgi:predicted transcriptional regulator
MFNDINSEWEYYCSTWCADEYQLREGLADIAAGRVKPLSEVRQQLKEEVANAEA